MAIVHDDKTDWVSDKRITTNREATQLSKANSMDTGKEAYRFDSNAFKTRHLESSTDEDNADEKKILRVFVIFGSLKIPFITFMQNYINELL